MSDQNDNLVEWIRHRHRLLLLFRKRWAFLLYTLGIVTTLFLCAAMLLFINSSWLPGALSVASSIVTGGAATWILSRANDAAEHEKQALADATKAEARAHEQARSDAADDERRRLAEQTRAVLIGRKNV
jgi:signal transduction histidine kinase